MFSISEQLHAIVLYDVLVCVMGFFTFYAQCFCSSFVCNYVSVFFQLISAKATM